LVGVLIERWSVWVGSRWVGSASSSFKRERQPRRSLLVAELGGRLVW